METGGDQLLSDHSYGRFSSLCYGGIFSKEDQGIGGRYVPEVVDQMHKDFGRTSLEIWRLNSVKKYKIIFSDIDGTLLNDENQVPKETVEELQSLDKRGIPFVL